MCVLTTYSLVSGVGNMSQGSGCTEAVAVVAPSTRESATAGPVPPRPVSASNSAALQVLLLSVEVEGAVPKRVAMMLDSC